MNPTRTFTAQTILNIVSGLEQKLIEIENLTAQRLRSVGGRTIQPVGTKLKLSGSLLELSKQSPSSDAVAKGAEALLKSLQSAQESRKAVLTQLTAGLASYGQQPKSSD